MPRTRKRNRSCDTHRANSSSCCSDFNLRLPMKGVALTLNDIVALPWLRWTVRLVDWWDHVCGKFFLKFRKHEIMKIAVVGDLSMQAHERLDRVLTVALAN